MEEPISLHRCDALVLRRECIRKSCVERRSRGRIGRIQLECGAKVCGSCPWEPGFGEISREFVVGAAHCGLAGRALKWDLSLMGYERDVEATK